jgi:hypothetical protein
LGLPRESKAYRQIGCPGASAVIDPGNFVVGSYWGKTGVGREFLHFPPCNVVI